MSSKKRIIYLTVIIAAALLFFIALGFRFINPAPDLVVEIRASGHLVAEIPLEDEEIVYAAGPLGDTVIVISDGSARIVDSPCPNHICVDSGAISKQGEVLICLPNRVSVEIKGCEAE